MGNDVAEVVEGLPPAQTIKVHARTCSELLKLVVGVSEIFPEIEAARPRCSSGIEALCLLNNGIVKVKSLLQHCSESSVLYLALTGEAIISRCKKSRNLLEQSLEQIQNMVPVVLAAKISGIIADLRTTAFCLDPPEEEAGKILHELLHRYGATIDYTEEAAVSAIQAALSKLRITSQKALLIEKRSIRKLLDKIGKSDPNKKKILMFFLHLLNKYGKLLMKEQKNNGSAAHEESFSSASHYDLSGEVELHVNYKSNEAQINMLSSLMPPEEFICPLTKRLMYDPVVIASGHTYERMWIQKWFDEGNDTCPKTNLRLAHLSFTSNTGMKDIILKWCATHGLSIPNTKIHEALDKSWETSINSIASLSSSINDLNLPLDFSNVSFGSSQGLSPSHPKVSNGVKSSHNIDAEFFTKFSSLPWDARCNVLEDVKKLLIKNHASWSMIPHEEFIEILLRFLKDAQNHCDVEAQMSGCVLLLEFMQNDRNILSYMKDDAYGILASFLDTEVAKHSLSILEELSFHQYCGYKIAASGALNGIFNILDCQIQELVEPALKILSNLSSKGDLSSIITPSDFIPKLISLFEDNTLARYCVTILKNLCDNEASRVCIAETYGCISTIAKLLECDSHEDQENAVSILLSLCSQRVLYCQLVMNEGVIPGLVNVCSNGNKKAKAMSTELLRILKDEVSTTGETSGSYVITHSPKQHKDKIPPLKSPGLFEKIFSKHSPFTVRKKKLNSNP